MFLTNLITGLVNVACGNLVIGFSCLSVAAMIYVLREKE